jgi:hypothetical protein
MSTCVFKWNNITPHRPQHISAYSTHFLEWFVGFSEGDGSFIQSGERLFFTITQKDEACLRRLRTELGFGTICHDHTYPEIKRFIVTDRRHIKILIHLFNGNLVLRKTQKRFASWVEHYVHLTGDSISLLDNTSSRPPFFLDTAWLSGFTDAEGCFNGYYNTGKHKIVLRFLLDQTDEHELFGELRNIFGVGCIWARKKTPESTHWRYEVESLPVLERLVQYFSRYTLRTHKNIAFVRWKKVLNLLQIIREEKKGHPVRSPLFQKSQKRERRLERLLKEITRSERQERQDKEDRKTVSDMDNYSPCPF